MTERRAIDGTRRGSGNYERWSPEDKARLAALMAEKPPLTLAQIARALNMDRDRVRSKMRVIAYRSGTTLGRAHTANAGGDPLPTMLHPDTPPWPRYESPLKDNLKACDRMWGVK